MLIDLIIGKRIQKNIVKMITLALTFSKCVVVFQIMDISLPFKIFKNNHIVYENMTPLATETREKGN